MLCYAFCGGHTAAFQFVLGGNTPNFISEIINSNIFVDLILEFEHSTEAAVEMCFFFIP